MGTARRKHHGEGAYTRKNGDDALYENIQLHPNVCEGMELNGL